MFAKTSSRILEHVFGTGAVATAARACADPLRSIASLSNSDPLNHICPISSADCEKVMDDLSIAAFEQRAAEAETRLAFLQMKLSSSEIQRSLVSHEDLLSIRQALVEAKAEAQKLQTEKDKVCPIHNL